MPDYSKGKIYTIRCHSNDKLIYVGSTIQSLPVRLGGHKRQKDTSISKYITNPENFTTWDDWYIELYEMYQSNCREELNKREREVIREIATINKLGYYADKKSRMKEYQAEHKDEIKARKKEYQAEHKDEIKEHKKEYYNNNRTTILTQKKDYYANHKDEIKKYDEEYRAKNRDKLLAQMKEYREKHKDEINAKRKELYKQKKSMSRD
jgi:sensor c-di-GMP phosphodiesterase-like protein